MVWGKKDRLINISLEIFWNQDSESLENCGSQAEGHMGPE